MSKVTIERPPGPRGRRLVGNSYDYDRDRIAFLRRCQMEYGDVFSFSPTTIVVCDPSLIHELFQQSNENFLAESPLFADAEESAQLERNIDGWMRSRRLGWKGMTRAVTRIHGIRIVNAFDAALRETHGRNFDVVSVMRTYSSRMVADFLFGTGGDEVVAAADRRSELAVKFMNTNLTIPRWLPLPSVRRALRSEDRVIATITDHVRDRRAHPHARPEDMLDLLLSDSEVTLTEDEVVTVLGASLLASFGSPGAALAWVVYEMSRDPELTQRLRDEALGALDETGSLTDDNRLPLSRAFAKEILRLYPPTWLMGRLVRRPCQLGGWHLEPGQDIMFSPYLLHRDPRFWTDPDQLRPERWLEATTPETRRAYIPFGAGPRVCLGLHLGMYQLVTAISHLAAHYRIESNASEVHPVPHAVLLPVGLHARVVPVPRNEPTALLPSDTTTEVTN